MLPSWYEAHGYEDIAYHVTGIDQACLHLVETGIGGIDVFFLYLYLVVFLTPGTVVGLLPRLRLRICLHIVGVWSRLIGSSD